MGLVRQNNEDNFTVCVNLAKPEWAIPQVGNFADLGEYGSLLLVADGMGGANAGEVASAIAVETIQQAFAPEKLAEIINDDDLMQQFMKESIKAADLNIVNQAKADEARKGMGTTIVMSWIIGSRAFVCWCGDSRCYVLNKRKGLIRLSKDHSFVQELIDKGEMYPEQAIDHPLSNIITRCLGNSENRAEPETVVYQLRDDDFIMLCSDGLCGLVNDSDMEHLMLSHKDDPEQMKGELMTAALEAGGHDNITIAICAVKVDGEVLVDEEQEPIKNDDNNLSATVRDIHPKKHLWIVFLAIALAAIAWYIIHQSL